MHTQSSGVHSIQIEMVLNKVHDIQIDREDTASNSEVMGKLVDVDNHDEGVESTFGDRDFGMGEHFTLQLTEENFH